MIFELEITKTHPIVLFAYDLITTITNIKQQGWHKKIICSPSHYIDETAKHLCIVNESVVDIIHIVSELLSNYNFNVMPNITDCVTELHYTNAYNQPEYSMFDIHCDNDIGIPVNTLLCYVSTDCDGGDLDIYDSNDNIINTINIRTNNDMIKVIMMSGNVKHKPTPITNGHRLLISFLIPTTN